MTSRKHFITTLLTAATTVLAAATTPEAGAAPTAPTCVELGPRTTQCQTRGNVQITAGPPPVEYPFPGPFSVYLHHGRHHSDG